MKKAFELKFHNFKVKKIFFDRGDDNNDEYKYTISVRYHTEINQDNNALFKTVIMVEVQGVDSPLFIQVVSMGNFEITGDVPDHVRENFINVSAPGIVYPYTRALISNVSVQSGIQPIVLTAMEFGNNNQAIKTDN